jgi:dihydrofolate reductase
MRNLIYAINVSLDGCCDHTKFGGGNEKVLEHYTQLMGEAGVIVYGRKTYQLMVPYWPEAEKDPTSSRAEVEYARAFNPVPKVVFSKSLQSVDDKNARIAHTDLRDEILKLKQEPGKPILTGGVDVPSQLIALGLVDEYRVMVAPVVVGEGRRLMQGVSLPKGLPLKLVDSKTIGTGFVALRYVNQ